MGGWVGGWVEGGREGGGREGGEREGGRGVTVEQIREIECRGRREGG